MSEDQKGKIGRNEPCPCGSGKKYKKCHGIVVPQRALITPPSDEEFKKITEKLKTKEAQRVQQQGLGRPIISTMFKGYRFVAVGSRFYHSKGWKTFHDFLFYYLKAVVGMDWGNAELKKTFDERHPVIQWYDYVCREQKKFIKQAGEVANSIMTGAVFAYLTLAYNLYLIAHNTHLVHGEGLHARLVERLKNKESFYPAFYETMVVATFIKAGFQIELENEDEPISNHAEFVAISPKTNEKYSVEAKHRQMGKEHTVIRNQLYDALKKELPHKRVIFINLNVPDNITSDGRIKWMSDVMRQMRNGENTITVNGKPAPQAYVFVTNHPFLYNLESFNFPPAAIVEGFKMPDLKLDTAFLSLRDALKSREKHIDMLNLIEAMREYEQIPATFDGEIPEYTFGEIEHPRLTIGNKYLVPDASGKDIPGELVECIVVEQKKIACGVYKLDDGRHIIANCPLSDKEMVVYRKHPDTFFGAYRKVSKRAKDELDLYDFFYGCYKKTPKEKLLELMKEFPDLEKLKNESQEELAKIYCERLVYAAKPINNRDKPEQK